MLAVKGTKRKTTSPRDKYLCLNALSVKMKLTVLLVFVGVLVAANAASVRSTTDLPKKCSALVKEHGISVVKFLANLDEKRVPDLGVLCDKINGCDDSLLKTALPRFKSLRTQKAAVKVAAKTCPTGAAGDCSGNGVCISECGVNGEKQAKCMCDSGYGGEDCSQDLCPKGCGNGVCKRGKCFCEPGFSGADCKTKKKCKGKGASGCNGHGICKYGKCFCDIGFEGKTCDTIAECPKDCSGNGICTKGQCKCNKFWGGKACEQFLNKKKCPTSDHGMCSGNGICHDGACICSPQFIGVGCEKKKRCVDDCNGNGECFLGACVCKPGYTGESCKESIQMDCSGHGVGKGGHCICQPGYEGVSCETKSVCPVDEHGETCGGKGVCSGGECFCFPGWTGKNCAANSESIKEEARVTRGCPNNCNSHGVCAYGLSDKYGTPLGQCLCQPGWHGPGCEHMEKCPGEGGGCNGRGKCVAGKCYCRPGYGGPGCLDVVFNATKCPKACSNQGTCLLGECFCNPGFLGDACDKTVECPNKCSGKGACKYGKCFCSPGFSGEDCSIKEKCPNACSNNGVCVRGKCLCVPGYYGDACDKSSCDESCENGICAQGKCFCSNGWTGKSCDMKVPLPSQNATMLKEACQNKCSGHGTCDLSNNGKAGMCFACNCDKNWSGEDCSKFMLPEVGSNKCNLIDADCHEGGKVDMKTCRCMCGDCREGKFCTRTKQSAACQGIQEKNFKAINHNVIDRANMKRNDPLETLDELVSEDATLEKQSKKDAEEANDEFSKIQNGAMLEIKSKTKKPCLTEEDVLKQVNSRAKAQPPLHEVHLAAKSAPIVVTKGMSAGVVVVGVVVGLVVGVLVGLWLEKRRRRETARQIMEEEDSYATLPTTPIPSISL